MAVALLSVQYALAAPDLLNEAIASYKAGRYLDAVSRFQAYGRAPGADQAQAHYYLGLCYQSLNQIANAQSQYRWVADYSRNETLRRYAQSALGELGRYQAHRSDQGYGNVVRAPRSAGAAAVPRGSYKPKVLDFFATWCGPCKQLAPLLDELEGRYGSRVEFQRLDVDDPSNAELKEKYNVNAFPTLIFLDSRGQVANRLSGVPDRQYLSMMIDQIAGR